MSPRWWRLLPACAVLGVLAADVLPAIVSAAPVAGVGAVASAAVWILVGRLPLVVACLLWPLLESPRFRARAPRVAVTVVLVNLVATWVVVPWCDLLSGRFTMALLGSDDMIKQWKPSAWSPADFLVYGPSAQEGVVAYFVHQRLGVLAFVLLALLPLFFRRVPRGVPWLPLGAWLAGVTLGFGPWHGIHDDHVFLALAVVAQFIPWPARVPAPAPARPWRALVAGPLTALAFYAAVAGQWTWSTVFAAPRVLQRGETLTASLPALDGHEESIGREGDGPVLVVTWAGYCVGCPGGLRWAADLRARVGPSKVRVLALDIVGREDAEEHAARKVPPGLVTVFDGESEIPLDRGAVPGFFLFDGSGTLREGLAAELNSDRGRIEKALASVLEGR